MSAQDALLPVVDKPEEVDPEQKVEDNGSFALSPILKSPDPDLYTVRQLVIPPFQP